MLNCVLGLGPGDLDLVPVGRSADDGERDGRWTHHPLGPGEEGERRTAVERPLRPRHRTPVSPVRAAHGFFLPGQLS